jgi:hypothetical protein
MYCQHYFFFLPVETRTGKKTTTGTLKNSKTEDDKYIKNRIPECQENSFR